MSEPGAGTNVQRLRQLCAYLWPNSVASKLEAGKLWTGAILQGFRQRSKPLQANSTPIKVEVSEDGASAILQGPRQGCTSLWANFVSRKGEVREPAPTSSIVQGPHQIDAALRRNPILPEIEVGKLRTDTPPQSLR